MIQGIFIPQFPCLTTNPSFLIASIHTSLGLGLELVTPLTWIYYFSAVAIYSPSLHVPKLSQSS